MVIVKEVEMDIFRSRINNKLFKMIKDDHDRIENALQQIENSAESERGYLLRNLKRELIPHMRAEEMVLYPVLKNNIRTHEGSLLSYEQHRLADVLISQLDQTSAGDETWKAKMIVLKEVVTNHIREEEGNVFSETSKAIPEGDLNNMAGPFQREKESVISSTLAGEPSK
jgi:hemerythrin superfamily protein